MSKAVLVMDMPKKCGECPLYKVVAGNELCRAKIRATSVEGTLVAAYAKPDWCPLRDLPVKKERLVATNDYDGGYSHGFTYGYNACIDELLKEE